VADSTATPLSSYLAPVAHRNKGFDQRDLDGIRSQLRARIEEVSREIDELTRPPERGSGIGFGKRVGDGTSEAITRFTDVGVANDLEAIRSRSERALQKLEQGSYGICDECGERIASGRLAAAPESALCIACASASR